MLWTVWWILAAWAAPEADPTVRAVALLEEELAAAEAAWAATDQPVPHHVSVALRTVDHWQVAGWGGGLDTRPGERNVWLDVDLRIGTAALDSTHPLRGFSMLAEERPGLTRAPWGWADDPDHRQALRHVLRRTLSEAHRQAVERYELVLTEQRVRVEEEDPAPDFEPREPARVLEPPDDCGLGAGLPLAAEGAVRGADRVFAGVDDLVGWRAYVDARRTRVVQVDSEGAAAAHTTCLARAAVRASVVAEDGDALDVWEAADAFRVDDLPLDTVPSLAEAAAAEARALRAAPRVGAWSGPVLLSGRAAAVFVHEVLGHRAEGHRNKSDREGKTFADRVGERVLPPWIDIVDDPTRATFAGQDLRGHYAVDDEGVPAQPAVLVEDGVYRGFLMGRSPLPAVPHSNGHGRRSPGRAPTSRMGNTILTAEQGLDDAGLRARLLELAAEQGHEHAYVVEDIAGGFTLTGRIVPNAFNVRATRTVKVFVDGRPDQLVRGIDLVGTPMVAFAHVVAAGDTPAVFNGTCGAESGQVPVSAVAPPLLISRLEFQLKEKGSSRPPLLPRPRDDDASAEAP